MSDQEQAPVEETPGVDDTPSGTVAEQVDWEAKFREQEQRYNNLQPKYTRTTQELARYRDLQSDDPEARARAAEALGLQFADEEDDEYADPTDQLRKEIERDRKEFAAFKANIEAEKEKAEEEAALRRVDALIDSEAEALGLTGRVKNAVVSLALAAPWNEQGPDMRAAFKEWEEVQTELKKGWRDSKRTPHVSSVGTPATQVPNLDSHAERVAYIQERARQRDAE